MAPPIRPPGNSNQGYGGGGGGSENPPSNNLWIGNVSQDVSEAELKALFEKYGKIDSVTTYSSRNYAFVQFKETEEARSAKLGLQGFFFHGNPLKIEFAKPVGDFFLINRGFHWFENFLCVNYSNIELVGIQILLMYLSFIERESLLINNRAGLGFQLSMVLPFPFLYVPTCLTLCLVHL